MATIGERMKYVRVLNGKLQKEVAELLGTTEATVSRFENNKRNPKADYVRRFAELFQVDVNFLYGKTDDPQLKNNAVMIEKDKLVEEIRELGVEYITVAKEAKEAGIEIEDLKAAVEFIKKTRKK